MKKLIIMFAILFVGMVSTASAHSIIADARTTEGAANQVLTVFNNAGATLDVGDVVVWDFVNSTGNNDLYVTTTTTTNTGLVAGVVTQEIVDQSTGGIVIYGFATCDIADAVEDNTLICTSSTAGSGTNCTAVADEAQAYAIATEAIATSGSGNCFVTF